MDVLGNFNDGVSSTSATYHRRVLPGLALAASPAKLRKGRTTTVRFTVRDAGDPVKGARVKAGGEVRHDRLQGPGRARPAGQGRHGDGHARAATRRPPSGSGGADRLASPAAMDVRPATTSGSRADRGGPGGRVRDRPAAELVHPGRGAPRGAAAAPLRGVDPALRRLGGDLGRGRPQRRGAVGRAGRVPVPAARGAARAPRPARRVRPLAAARDRRAAGGRAPSPARPAALVPGLHRRRARPGRAAARARRCSLRCSPAATWRSAAPTSTPPRRAAATSTRATASRCARSCGCRSAARRCGGCGGNPRP